MKLSTFTKEKRAEREEAPPFKKKASSWAMTTSSSRNAAMEAQKALSGPRAPETWVGDGESKKFRMLIAEPIGLFRYQFQIGGKWHSFTKPGRGEADLFQSELNLAPSYKAVWIVLDYAGYTDKEGKVQKNLARYWLVSGRLNSQLEALGDKYGDLTGYDIEVRRIGSDKNTTYQLFQERKSVIDPKIRASLPNLRAKFEEYYAPPTEEQQEAIVAAYRAGGGA